MGYLTIAVGSAFVEHVPATLKTIDPFCRVMVGKTKVNTGRDTRRENKPVWDEEFKIDLKGICFDCSLVLHLVC